MMDNKLWSNLPDVLLERILAKLPIACLLRFRSVSKAWNTLIVSSSFLQLCSDLSSQTTHHVLLTTFDNEHPLIAFDPAVSKWLTAPLQSMSVKDEFFLVTAAGGLLCFSNGTDFVVCNPITKARKQIPCQPQGESAVNAILIGLRIDRERKGYQILVVGDTDCCTQLYDSTHDSWRMAKQHQKEFCFESNGVFYREIFFVMASFPRRVLAFDTKNATWSTYPAPLPEGLVSACLVECSGRLWMVGTVSGCVNELGLETEPEWFQLWALNEEVQEWEVLATMPETIWLHFFKNKEYFDGFSCVGQGCLIYLTSYHGSPALVFDASELTWRWLPDCEILATHQFCIRDLFTLEPMLDALK